MHTTNFDLSVEELTKVEGTASLDIKVRSGVVTECRFSLTEMKRFFTQAIRGKPIVSVPQLVARICGTCSNAHLLASLKAIESALSVVPSAQTQLLRKLLNFGLIIRDHGLHLYVFVLPDLFHRRSLLDFDDQDPREHQFLHDCFAVKEVGNQLSIATGGRSVHAPYPTIGGFLNIPSKTSLQSMVSVLEGIRPNILRLVNVFLNAAAELAIDTQFLALADPAFSFLDGQVRTSTGEELSSTDFLTAVQRTVIPYSQASGYLLRQHVYTVGALARLNLNQGALHPRTRRDTADALGRFPSHNIFHNNLAQAVEMLHAVDMSIDLIRQYQAIPESPLPFTARDGEGVGIIEAPRGTLCHRVETAAGGKIKKGAIIVPTGQNQASIELSLRNFVSAYLDHPREVLAEELEQVVRAYDPCMSCASHFLKVRWA